MRLVIRGVVVLVILIAAYWSWALVGAAQLASAAHSGDVDAVMERVNLQALIRSLASQICARLSRRESATSKVAGGSARRHSEWRRGGNAAARPSDAREYRGAPEPGTR